MNDMRVRGLLYRTLAGGFVVAGLQGCATSPADCDPAKHTGFLATVNCVAMYEKRQEMLAGDIEAERNLNAASRQMLVSIEAEREDVGRQRRGKEAEMTMLNRSWENLKQSLSVKAEKNADLQKRIETLQNQMNEVNASRGMDQARQQQRLDSLRRQVQLLMSELEAGMY